ncbi:IQ calmodulin-binding motif family protein [Trichomonas vaginalis G3]|uniref:IQ calmodulin-binding motif family protein n=1 Tax=Trichomonas vaginalis (strain ATCC PRA-98 / G3) TaxID=412133 RepID=A2DBN1_TRIV3|nr:spermatogenesis-associated protein 17 family [Trichomonas vaginalis G3]EAY22234.1 IQ calmodulin-binding motif family protein [Trichomonas vaginalis G3]KAI5533308.1 spermatogenesis-associated protein 17 family [Trichomonas vaginalis G3]|eukprot:XP_001583220.1 IQ calmodulin-binding motif family protein [Trichomonas vaginalis G3]
MASFANIYRNRRNIVNRYFTEIEKAQECREKEYRAALTIQAAWRKYKILKRRKLRNESAIKIQKTWRMFHEGMLFRCLKTEKETEDRNKLFNEKARKIQKVWRGYWERKHVFDFNKQKAFMNDVQKKNEEMELMLDNYYTQTSEAATFAEEEQKSVQDVKKALHTHYLVSTSAIPSIYQPPAFTKDAAAMPAIEQFIRTVNKAKIVVPSIGKR